MLPMLLVLLVSVNIVKPALLVLHVNIDQTLVNHYTVC